jgi:hypothetical protein
MRGAHPKTKNECHPEPKAKDLDVDCPGGKARFFGFASE